MVLWDDTILDMDLDIDFGRCPFCDTILDMVFDVNF